MGYRKGDYFDDAKFALVEELLPGRPGTAGKRAKDNRLFLEGVFHVAREGIPWAALPKRFGNWRSAHTRFIRWRKSPLDGSNLWRTVIDELHYAKHREYRWSDTECRVVRRR